jgi:hypothetical protein
MPNIRTRSLAKSLHHVSVVCKRVPLSSLARMIKHGSYVSLIINTYESTLLIYDSPDNLRYAFDTCLFGFAEANDPMSTPCSTDSSCGHLQKALQTGDLDPTASTYGYCSADNNAFLGSFLPKCLECLQNGGDTQYLTNCK